MSDVERAISQRLREDLSAWIDERLPAICAGVLVDRALPVTVDFYLVVATEDGADPESDTYYSTVSSGTSHYRKVGLVRTAMRILLTDDSDD